MNEKTLYMDLLFPKVIFQTINKKAIKQIENGKGVWLGRRSVGFQNHGGRRGRLLPNHHVVAINGDIWHLMAQKKETGVPYQVVKCEEAIHHFDWTKQGETVNNPEPLIKNINQKIHLYNLFSQNCQHVGKSLYMFATGKWSLQQALTYLSKQ